MTYHYHEQIVTCWESDSVKYAQKCYWACFPAFLLQFILEGKQHHFILNQKEFTVAPAIKKPSEEHWQVPWRLGKWCSSLDRSQAADCGLHPTQLQDQGMQHAATVPIKTAAELLQTSDPAYVFCNGILQLYTPTHLHTSRAHHHPQITPISLFPLSLYIYSCVKSYSMYICMQCTKLFHPQKLSTIHFSMNTVIWHMHTMLSNISISVDVYAIVLWVTQCITNNINMADSVFAH